MSFVRAVCLLASGATVTDAAVPSWACELPMEAPPSVNGTSTLRGALRLHAVKAQQTEAATVASLASYIKEGKQDLLVVFYAPWCGHCKQFVMHDASGNPDQAPLELLNKDLIAKKGPKVLKFDTQGNGLPDQSQFKTEYIPTIYLASKNGAKTKFEGDSHDVDALKDFALNQAPVAGAVALHNMGKSIMRSDVCMLKAQQTEAATVASLASYRNAGKQDLLVVFYAPWCGHCQQFVMYDASGNPDNAPIELLNKELIAQKGPKVLKFDTQANGLPDQSQFKTEFIPTIYFASKSGVNTKFEGDSQHVEALKDFALKGAK